MMPSPVVVLTRAPGDNAELAALAAARGAEVRTLVCLHTEPAGDRMAQRSAIEALGETQALVFASRSAVQAFAQLMGVQPTVQGDSPALAVASAVASDAGGPRALPPCFAVGPGTADAVQRVLAVRAQVPAVHSGAGLLALLCAHFAAEPVRLLLPAAVDGRTELAQGLARCGHSVVRLPVYRTVPAPARSPQVTWDARVHYIVVTSPSCVTGFFAQAQLPVRATFVSIGPTTTAALVRRGVGSQSAAIVEAESHDAPGLCTSLKHLLESP